MFKSVLLTLAAIVGFALAVPATAGDFGVDVTFTAGEAATIRAYYRDHDTRDRGPRQGGKKGGKHSLPPGIEKNLQRGKRLPPGIAKQALPGALISQLPPPPDGFERITLSGKVLLVEVATQVVHDILEDVIL